MDSAFKNQVLAGLYNTIGNNQNPTNEDRDTIFLLVQYLADNINDLTKAVDNIHTQLTNVNTYLNNLEKKTGEIYDKTNNINERLDSVITYVGNKDHYVKVATPNFNWVAD